MRFFIYFDSTRKIFSVRDQQSRRVVFKAPALTLRNCQFVVSERGRQRVLRTRKKTVHAGVACEKFEERAAESHATLGTPARYNPYQGPNFVRLDGTPITEARRVTCLVEDGKARVYCV